MVFWKIKSGEVGCSMEKCCKKQFHKIQVQVILTKAQRTQGPEIDNHRIKLAHMVGLHALFGDVTKATPFLEGHSGSVRGYTCSTKT